MEHSAALLNAKTAGAGAFAIRHRQGAILDADSQFTPISTGNPVLSVRRENSIFNT
jgi:hypothetical protein